MDQTFMKTRKVFPLVCSMALPMVISMLVNSLYNIIDSYFVARISEDAMTALSLIFPLQNIVAAVSIGFGVGVNAAASFFMGTGDSSRASAAASLGMILSIVHGLVLTLVMMLVMPSFLRSFGASREIVQAGLDYGYIVMAFSLVDSVSLCYEKLFQSVGRMRISMFCLLAGCIVNIILDPLMIFGLGPFPEMGIRGAALATGIGLTVPLIFYLIFYRRGLLGIRIRMNPLQADWRLAGRLYLVGVPAALNQALPSLQISVLNIILSGFGGSGVLILGIYNKLQTFIYLTSNGIIQGIRPLAGYNYGAGEMARLRRISRTALTMCLVIMAAGMILSLAIPDRLMGLFLHDPAVIDQSARALRIISAGFLASAFSFTWSGMLEGMGKGIQSLIIMLLRYVVIIIPAAFLLSRIMGSPDGVWHAFWITEWTAMVISFYLYRKVMAKAETEIGGK